MAVRLRTAVPDKTKVPPSKSLVTDGAFPEDPIWLVICEIRLPIAPRRFRGAFCVRAGSKRAAESVALAHSDTLLVGQMLVIPWEGALPKRVSWIRPRRRPSQHPR